MSNEEIAKKISAPDDETIVDASGTAKRKTAEEIRAIQLQKEEASTPGPISPYATLHKGETVPYYVGLDIGTDSVGLSVTDTEYDVLRFRGEPMMCSHLFDAAEGCAKRRGFRTARRRLDRRNQRVQLIREIFAKEVCAIDPKFFLRQQANVLDGEVDEAPSVLALFDDPGYGDKEFHAEYPTIFHLMKDLRTSKSPKDVRLLCLAVSYLVAHRGHFLYQINKESLEEITSFDVVYADFVDAMDGFEQWPSEVDVREFGKIMRTRVGVNAKTEALTNLLFGEKKPPKPATEDTLDCASIIKLLAGGKTGYAKLFNDDSFDKDTTVQLSDSEEKIEEALGMLEEQRPFVECAKRMYDWGMLANIMNDQAFISDAKIAIYEKHKQDLRTLRRFVKRYGDRVSVNGRIQNRLYAEVFNDENEKANYAGYSKGRSKQAAFCEWIEKKLPCNWREKELTLASAGDAASEAELQAYEDMFVRMGKDLRSFLPKQVSGDNRVLPYQVFYAELKAILDQCKTYLPFLTTPDADGLTPYKKILDTFCFRIPYYVGPLNAKSPFAWIQRKAEKIYPWNFDEVVDLDACEQAFIDNMTNSCSYLASETVLPKNSLLYSKYAILNEINNIKISDGIHEDKISVDHKQDIFRELYQRKSTVRVKDIEHLLISKGAMNATTEHIIGIDTEVKGGKLNNQYTPYHAFKAYIDGQVLTEAEVEDIINHMAYSEDSFRLRKWLEKTYPQLDAQARKSIANKNLKGFGRLSKRFLAGQFGLEDEDEQMMSIIDLLWCTNSNLMEILGRKYGYSKRVERENGVYYQGKTFSMTDRINDLHISPAVKRSVTRTMDMLKDVKKAMGGKAPEAVFVEMARDVTENDKGDAGKKKKKRTVSRKNNLANYYKAHKGGEYGTQIQALEKELEKTNDKALSKKSLFLYFMQLGKDMYTGQPIDIEHLESYNIDHIYPQSKIKDDSFDNMVLVSSRKNAEKGDGLVDKAIIEKMQGFWRVLRSMKLISAEKYRRLTRTTPFDDDDLAGFINRQIVETRQSTKAVCALLKAQYPEANIVYVKAGLVSEFRKTFFFPKSRTINDLHHAKDAYLNIVVGDMYYRKFTKPMEKYGYVKLTDKEQSDAQKADGASVKAKTLFNYPRRDGGVEFWHGLASMKKVRALMNKDNIHLTKYAYCGHGGFFDQNPLVAKEGAALLPRKKGLEDTSKYGGYAKPSLSFYVLAKYNSKKKTKLLLVPIETLYASTFERSEIDAMACIKRAVLALDGDADMSTISLPLHYRKIKINTVVSLDGFRATISGKGNGGDLVLCAQNESLVLSTDLHNYIAHIEDCEERRKKNSSITIDYTEHKISTLGNLTLYDAYLAKASSRHFGRLPGSEFASILSAGRDIFATLSIDKQVSTLLNIGKLLKSNRKGTVDLSQINGKSHAASVYISSNISNWQKTYKDVRIIDTSASGFFERRSANLLDYLKD